MEGIITLIIFIITAVGWISNAVNEKKIRAERQQQGGNKPKQPKRQLQDEIAAFLQEVKQRDGEGNQPAGNNPPARKKRQQPFQQKKAETPRPRPEQQPAKSEKLSEHHLESNIGKKKRKKQPRQSRPHVVQQQVPVPNYQKPAQPPADLGPSLLDSAPMQQSTARRNSKSFADMMKSKDDFRNAFILSEILQPVSRRRRSS